MALLILLSSVGCFPNVATAESIAPPQTIRSPTVIIAADPQPRQQLDDVSASLLDAFAISPTSTTTTNGNLNAVPAPPPMYSPTGAPPSSEGSASSDMEKTLQNLQKRKQINPRTHG
eukprot:CAMPEP_0168736282 /NCGR_PEP_ID=MMETSP0724-20121128/9781_1 /TAXON_ID=265536 /ORGANISM="Amphiprora sp., Strain CCMP467" /LENGTH=116 /DNA_ID=CAMNT_0008783477 /DNA_START=279 /DNA_END=629 /DNA_ORIENTATION=+